MSGKYYYFERAFDRRDHGDRWMPSEFQRGAITASFFTAHPFPSSGEFCMDWDDWNSLDEAERIAFIERCEQFEKRYAKTLAYACEVTGNDMETAGRDYHYTSAGHGIGFWDGDWRGSLPRNRGDIGDALARVCRAMPCHEVHGYIDDCEHYRETGEGCGDCEACEAGPQWELERKACK